MINNQRGEATVLVVMFTVGLACFVGAASFRIAAHFGSNCNDINRRLAANEYVSDAEIEKGRTAFSKQIAVLGAGGDFIGSAEFEGNPQSLGTFFQGAIDEISQRASDPAVKSDAPLPRDIGGDAAGSADPRTPSLTLRAPAFILAGQTKYVQIEYQDADNDIQTMTVTNGVRMKIPGFEPTVYGGQPITSDVSKDMNKGVGTHQVTIKAAEGISGEGVELILSVYLTDRQGHKSATQTCTVEVR